MSNTILQLEVKLLLLKYGRNAVLESLANVSKSTLEEVEQEIRQQIERKPVRKSRQSQQREEKTMDRLLKERPDLERFVSLYRAKLLLPSLRDVKAFLSAHGAPATVKARQAALPKVLRVLMDFTSEDLQTLEQANSSGRDAEAFSILADELMIPSNRHK